MVFNFFKRRKVKDSVDYDLEWDDESKEFKLELGMVIPASFLIKSLFGAFKKTGGRHKIGDVIVFTPEALVKCNDLFKKYVKDALRLENLGVGKFSFYLGEAVKIKEDYKITLKCVGTYE